MLRAVTPFTIILVLAVGAWFVGRKRRSSFLYEASLILGGYFAYFGVRTISEGSTGIALENARRLIELEQHLGLFIEPRIQNLLLGSDIIISLVNWIYVWGHWPVIGGVAIWLFARRPKAYRVYRNALLISGGIGLIFFATFPAAPPRFTDLGLVDTVFSQSNVAQLLQPAGFTNEYAAFPSLHFGWSLLMATAIFRESDHTHARRIAWLLPTAMLISIVATANHFLIDALGGGTVALTGLLIAQQIDNVNLAKRVRQVLPQARPPSSAAIERTNPWSVSEFTVPLDIDSSLGYAITAIRTEPLRRR